jgi:hypothetical protein
MHKNRKFLRGRNSSCFLASSFDVCIYYAEIAPVGHVSEHAPQSIHVSGSISYLLAPSDIDPVGQSPAQAPQLMHSSLIVYAIVNNLLFKQIDYILIQAGQ